MAKFKDVLKFDSGADVFLFMCWVLGISAFLVLILGIYFIRITF